MTKKILFSLLGLLVIIALRFGYKYRQDSDNIISQIPRSQGVKMISQTYTGTLTTGSIDTGTVLSGEDRKDEIAIDTSKIPVCENKLNPITVIDMDKVVKNCTEKKKEGRTLDGLGGVPPQYIFSNGSAGIVLYDNNAKIDLLCKDKGIGGDEFYVRRLNNDDKMPDNDYVNFPLNQLNPIFKVAKKNIFSELNYGMYTDNMYCGGGQGENGIDQDCADMHESNATSDVGYYFVAGFRDDMKGQLLYAINDKIYSPGNGDNKIGIGNYDNGYNEKHLGQGVWQFVTVKDNKIIVKRMKDERINMNKKDENDMNTTTYTLQTCEISL